MTRVTALSRYPIKSLLGESIPEAQINVRGVAGDRVAALIADGRVVSGKQIRRWGALFELSAGFDGDGEVCVRFPDGSVSSPPLLDLALSSYLGARVAVTRELPDHPVAERTPLQPGDPTEFVLGRAAPAGGFFDYAPLHLISTSTLEAVGVAHAERFRPNLVVTGPEPATGDVVHLGDEVVVRIITPTPRCAVPPLRHGSAPPDPGLLRRLPRTELGLIAGVYAEVIQGGTVRVGDVVAQVPAA